MRRAQGRDGDREIREHVRRQPTADWHPYGWVPSVTVIGSIRVATCDWHIKERNKDDWFFYLVSVSSPLMAAPYTVHITIVKGLKIVALKVALHLNSGFIKVSTLII